MDKLIIKGTSVLLCTCFLMISSMKQCMIRIDDSEWNIDQAINAINEVLISNGIDEVEIEDELEHEYTTYCFDISDILKASITLFYGGDIPQSILYKIIVDGTEPPDKSAILGYILDENPIIIEISDAISQKSFDRENLLNFEREFIDTFNDELLREGVGVPLRKAEYCKSSYLFPDCHVSVRYVDLGTDSYHYESVQISGYIK